MPFELVGSTWRFQKDEAGFSCYVRHYGMVGRTLCTSNGTIRSLQRGRCREQLRGPCSFGPSGCFYAFLGASLSGPFITW